MFRRRHITRQGLRRPGPKAVDDSIETSQISRRQIENIFLYIMLGIRHIFCLAAKSRHIETAADRFRNNLTRNTTTSSNNSNFLIHNEPTFLRTAQCEYILKWSLP